MLVLLITLGRLSVIVAAAATIVAATVAGWLWGAGPEAAAFGFARGTDLTANQAEFAALGCLGGLAAAGFVFGLAAAVFDIQRSLRLLVRRELDYESGGAWQEQPASPQGPTRTEPRLTSAST